jgi:hypothetical protein
VIPYFLGRVEVELMVMQSASWRTLGEDARSALELPFSAILTGGSSLLAQFGASGAAAGALTAGREGLGNYIFGQPNDSYGLAVDTSVAALTAGSLTTLPGVSL